MNLYKYIMVKKGNTKKQRKQIMAQKRAAKEQKNLQLQRNDTWHKKKAEKKQSMEGQIIGQVKTQLKGLPWVIQVTKKQMTVKHPDSEQELTLSYGIDGNNFYAGDFALTHTNPDFGEELLEKLGYEYPSWKSNGYRRRGYWW